jgi:hypothetical protein
MEFRVQSYSGKDLSMDPSNYVPGKQVMVPLTIHRDNPADQLKLANARHRTFEFGRSGGTDAAPWTVKTDGGSGFNTDARRVSAAPPLANGPTDAGFSGDGTLEVWKIVNGGNGWSHPVHVHFEEGQVLQRGGKAPPVWEKGARKDMYRIGPLPDTTDSVDIAIRVREFLGTYVEHCHNTTHEDNAMLMRWDSRNPGTPVALQSPFPSWDGVSYVDTNTTDVPTYETGKLTDFLTKVAAPIANGDSASAVVGSAVTIPVLDNDRCVGTCDPASLTIGTKPTNGSAVVNGDGTVTYTANAAGSDSFTYTVRDTTTGTQVSNVATVALSVGGTTPPAAPVAVNDSATTVAGTVVGINVIANDSNCGSGCTVAIGSAPLHGTAVANSPAAGQVSYTPAGGFTGTDSFSYTATNAGGTSAQANVTVNVAPNPVTDIVTIAKATLSRRGSLSASGTVSLQNGAFAQSVEVFAGPANVSHTDCTGTDLGAAAVSSQASRKTPAGSWSFSKNGVSATSVCVKSANGGVADRPL